MAAGLLKEATSLRVPREKGPNKGLIRQPTVTWNGFSSHYGIGKTSLKVVRKQANPRHTPYNKKNKKCPPLRPASYDVYMSLITYL
jgi:hypothetical protein